MADCSDNIFSDLFIISSCSQQGGNISLRLFGNSEALSSELLEKKVSRTIVYKHVPYN